MLKQRAHVRLENPDNPAEGLCELCATTWPCYITELRAEVERLKALNQHQVTLVEQARAEREDAHAEIVRLREQIAFTEGRH